MTWNYRVLIDDDGMCQLIEAYYNETGELFGYVDASVDSDTPENLARSLGTMLDDVLRTINGETPVLRTSDLPQDADA